MKITAIIGFGFCGRIAFYHLAKIPNHKIIIFDEQGEDAIGPAFSRFSPHYILNVPAEKMSAFSDYPQDFVQFLEKKYPQILHDIGEKGFAPRQIYGEYLQALTLEAVELAKNNNVEVEFIQDKVVEIFDVADGVKINLITKNNKSYQASDILLATSFTQSELPFNFKNNNFVKKLWHSNSAQFHQQNFADNETICLIGSGLTAVDVIVGLQKKNFNGKIFVISRRGNFPQKHFRENPLKNSVIEVDDAKKGVLFLCLKIRKFLFANPHCDLRHAIDSMRPITKKLWQNLDARNKKLFLRLLPYWNIFRHRAPNFSIEIIEKMQKKNQLIIKKHGVKRIIENLGGLNMARDFECTAVPDLRTSVENVILST